MGMFRGLVALLNLFPRTLPPQGATMTSHGHSWEGYEQVHCPHLYYHRIHQLRESVSHSYQVTPESHAGSFPTA